MLVRILAFSLASAVAGCHLFGFEGADSNDDYRRKWAGQHDGAYSYVLNRSCFCAPAGPFRIQVVDLEVVSAIDTRTQEPLDSAQLEFVESIEDIFDLIESARNEGAYNLHVEYAREGYPKVVNIDWAEMVADDELFLGVSDVVIGNPE